MINQFIKVSLFCLFADNLSVFAQDELSIWGAFQTNANLFLRDSAIGAFNIPQYDKQLVGTETWINLNISYAGFQAGIRYDLFNNSNLLNPNGSYTDHGLGRWYITKNIEKLELSVGYLYDQIGSGIIYRAFEERTQLIDNALLGFSSKYNMNKDWSLKAFAGKQKYLFGTNESFLKGVNLNGFYKKSDSSVWSISPGIGFLNKTLEDDVVQELAKIAGTYSGVDTFLPAYNSNALTLYNTLSYKDFTLYLEAAMKFDDIYYSDQAQRTTPNGTTLGKYLKGNGHVYYASLAYASHGFGITLEGKKTSGFDFRSDPRLRLNRGLVTFIPPMARINTYRLTSYYYPATQYLSEGAIQLDAKYGPNENWNFGLNFSNIMNENFEKKFYREYHVEATYKQPEKYQFTFGIQRQEFNQELYYGKGGEDDIKTIVPFMEFLYDFSEKNSLRIEAQYMDNKEDIGSWAYLLLEYGISPHWLFELSDMYNTKPAKKDKEKIHYPTAGLVYNVGNNRFSLRYVKQIQGIVCSGGICRLEPAFSGFRASIISNF